MDAERGTRARPGVLRNAARSSASGSSRTSAEVRRRRALGLGAGAAVGTLLAACGSSGVRTSRRKDTATPQAVVTAESPPRTGGVLRVRGTGTPALDPHVTAAFQTQVHAGAVFSRLLRFQAAADPEVSANRLIAPDLAATWEIAGDGLTVTFKLQPGARWHAVSPVNGRPVDSEDVRFSLERLRAQTRNGSRTAFGTPESPLVEQVQTPDAATLVVKLAHPYGPILSLFASPQHLWVLPRESASTLDPAKSEIGSGPFIFESLQPDLLVRCRRNPDYFVRGRPWVDALERVILAEDAQERAHFQSERLDLATLTPDVKPEIEKSNPRAHLLAHLPSTFTFISPQLRGNSPYRDERIRRALSLAINRKDWLEVMYPGTHGRCLGFVPASMGRWWLDPCGQEAGDSGRWFQFNPKESRALLRAAGAEELSLRFIYSNNAYGDKFNQGAEGVIAMLRDAGFKVAPVVQDYVREFIATNGTMTGNYDGVFYGLEAPFPDAHDYLFGMNHSTSRRNHAGVKDPEVDRLIDLAAQALNEDERVQRVKDVQRALMERMYYIPIAVGETYTAIQPWVRGYRYAGTFGAATESYSELWLDRS